MPRRPKTRTITVFLIKETESEPSSILKRSEVLTEFDVKINGQSHGRLFVQSSSEKDPSWLSLFRGSVNFGGLAAYNASTAAVWLTEVNGKLLALTFGYGRNLLKPGTWEEDFGLRVTHEHARRQFGHLQ